MKFDELEAALHKRSEGAPSDIELDRLLTGQLDPETAQEVEARALRNEESAQRLSSYRRGLDAFPEVDGRALLSRIRRAQDGQPKPLRDRLKALWIFLPLAAAAAVALVVLPHSPHPAEDATGVHIPTDTVRSKGSLKLEVLRRRGEHAESVASGSAFAAGDELRFRVSLPEAGRVTVVGVEENGTLYTAWPLDAHGAKGELPAGHNQVLPGAVVLDDSPGREQLHLVWCPAGVQPTCKSRGIDAPIACARGCRSTPFLLRKQ